MGVVFVWFSLKHVGLSSNFAFEIIEHLVLHEFGCSLS